MNDKGMNADPQGNVFVIDFFCVPFLDPCSWWLISFLYTSGQIRVTCSRRVVTPKGNLVGES